MWSCLTTQKTEKHKSIGKIPSIFRAPCGLRTLDVVHVLWMCHPARRRPSPISGSCPFKYRHAPGAFPVCTFPYFSPPRSHHITYIPYGRRLCSQISECRISHVEFRLRKCARVHLYYVDFIYAYDGMDVCLWFNVEQYKVWRLTYVRWSNIPMDSISFWTPCQSDAQHAYETVQFMFWWILWSSTERFREWREDSLVMNV